MKVLFYDADGTVMTKNKIPDRTYEAFRLLKANGILTVLSTGRSLPSIRSTPLEDLGLTNCITAAGGCVIINNQIVSHDYLTEEQRDEITDYFDQYHVPYNIECNDGLYTRIGEKERQLKRMPITLEEAGSLSEVERNKNRRSRFFKQLKEVESFKGMHANKIHWYEDKRMYDDGMITKSIEDIQKHFSSRYNVNPLSFNGNKGGGEINDKAITKKKGVEMIMKHFHIDPNDAYAIGDGYNDLQMLENVNHAIAMCNAPKEVKRVCSYVTDSIDEDGFYNAMKHFHLIQDIIDILFSSNKKARFLWLKQWGE